MALEPGTFGCNETEHDVDDLDLVNGNPLTLDGTGSDEVTVARSGSTLTIGHRGTFTANLDFTVSDDDQASATVASGQTFTETCLSDYPTNISADDATVNVSAGSLSWDGTTLTIDLRGAVSGGTCPGQQATLSLSCTKALLDQPGYGGN